MKLLFITQKLHGQDAFTALWAQAFVDRGYDVTVLCLEWRPEEVMKMLNRTEPFTFTVKSLGKEKGGNKQNQIIKFWWLISTLKYDRVFIHMTPVWGVFGAPVWLIKRTPVYLWYTHYKMQLGLRMIAWYGKRMFAATPQSMPQYSQDPKKVVVGHGIDLNFWPKRMNMAEDPKKLLVVQRLSRSKRLELVLQALVLLPDYTLDIYGIEAEPDYVAEMKALVQTLQLGDRVAFRGSAPASSLADIYMQHRLILNMATETIDKTMLEAMTCGCYPVITAGNARAVGISDAPDNDTPETIAAFVQKYHQHPPMSDVELFDVVAQRHSLENLIEKMDQYIRAGS